MQNIAAGGVHVSSYDWIDYFYRNAPEPILPWNDGMRLSGAERLAVIASIQQFQLGESASGARMMARAQRFSRAVGDLGLVAALKLFLREEQRHSRILARFLEIESASCLRKHWVDRVFRWMRGIAGLEMCLKMLATAEVVARPYYAALGEATHSPLLKGICDCIFEEEGAHLRFQTFALSRFERRHSRPVRSVIRACHMAVLTCAATIVWMEHQRVFRAAGRTFVRFWRDTWDEFDALYRTCSGIEGQRSAVTALFRSETRLKVNEMLG